MGAGVHQSLDKKDAILVGFRQSNPSSIKWLLGVVCCNPKFEKDLTNKIRYVNNFILALCK